MKKRTIALAQEDKKNIWHPLTQHKLVDGLLPIKKAKAEYLIDTDGKSYIDGISSWYTSMFGHCHPKIIDAVYDQMKELDQIVFSGFTHEPAIELSQKLINILPDSQTKLFFNDNGSTATEVGIKMALQYHNNQENDKDVLLAFEDGFHGDTLGAMSASGLSIYNGAFEKHFMEVKRIPKPTGDNNDEVIKQLNELLQQHKIAGFIYEPLIQGAAGMQFYDEDGLGMILQVCKENDIICIADEVMTGFGKTGKNFASEYLDIQPDVMCMSKALSAGMVPMGITSCSDKIYQAFYSDEIEKGLFHGHTYTGNPLACAAAIAAIELLQSRKTQQNISKISQLNERFAEKLKKQNQVKNVRTKGVILAFELDIEMSRYGSLRDELYQFFMDQGVFLRPLGNTIYILPPFITKRRNLQKIHKAILKCLKQFR
jgi:adenosylmethionine-8-amino-7-oxononanoate aminotransferase